MAPTPRGLALALDLPPPAGLEAACLLLPELVRVLLARLAAGRDTPLNRDAAGLAARMGQAGWGWSRFVAAALGNANAKPDPATLRVWKRLPEWEEVAPPPPPRPCPWRRARRVRGWPPCSGRAPSSGQARPIMPPPAAAAFAPRERRGEPHVVLAEAGTGTGKTLGYIAPASLWAERNKGAVWISTYTRHLQRQIDGELARLIPDPAERRARVVVRKGRENYLCLLNFEDAVARRRARDHRAARPDRALGAGDARTATSRAATCRAGLPNCSAPDCYTVSPTGAASASIPPARIGNAVSSSTRSAAPAPPTSWSPTTRW